MSPLEYKDGILLQLSETRYHGARADQHEANENIELAAREKRRHHRDAQDAGIGVVFPVRTDGQDQGREIGQRWKRLT